MNILIERLCRSAVAVLATVSAVSCTPGPVPGGESGGGGEGHDQPVPFDGHLIMDIVFGSDGSAEDISENANIVRSTLGNTVLVYFNKAFGGYVPRFINDPGSDITSGLYRAEYLADRSFRADLEDGFSVETMFMLDCEPAGDRMAIFSSVEDGGVGVSVASAVLGSEIVFELCVGQDARVVTLRSGVVPEKGKVYHVVGTWDKEEAVATLYVNGECVATFGTSGDLALPANPADQWFGIGCDAGRSASGQFPMRGDVYLARVYSKPAEAAQVSELWNSADRNIEASFIPVEDVMMFPVCEVGPGFRYKILGTGFRPGDVIRMEPEAGSAGSEEMPAEVYAGHVAVAVPDGVVDGTYRFFVKRGEYESPLGATRFIVSETAEPLSAPGAVAHRGYHAASGCAENSLAALRASQDLGVYGCEIDVWTTTDGVIVVHHDGVLAGKAFQDCVYDDIKDMKLSNGERLPLFSDMLAVLSEKDGTKLIVEIKEHSTVERNNSVTDEVLRMVSESGLEEKVEYICFDRDVCRRIASSDPDALVGYLSGDSEPGALAEEGIRCIDYPFATLNTYRYMIKDAHSLGMKVNVWTVNTDEDIMSSIALGVDYITTDCPDRVMEICSMLEE